MPVDYSKYPPDWKDIRERILKRSGHKCEGSPSYPDCRAINHQPHPVTGSNVVLTIGHMDHDSDNWEVMDERLRAWCQRCHLKYDIKTHIYRRKYGNDKNQMKLL